MKSLERRIPCPLGSHCPFDPGDLLTGVTIRCLPRVTLHLLQHHCMSQTAGCSVTRTRKKLSGLIRLWGFDAVMPHGAILHAMQAAHVERELLWGIGTDSWVKAWISSHHPLLSTGSVNSGCSPFTMRPTKAGRMHTKTNAYPNGGSQRIPDCLNTGSGHNNSKRDKAHGITNTVCAVTTY